MNTPGCDDAGTIERRVVHALDVTPAPLIVLDGDLRPLWANPAFAQLTGRTAAEPAAGAPDGFPGGLLRASDPDRLRADLAAGRVTEQAVRVAAADGSWATRSLIAVPSPRPDGSVEAWLVTLLPTRDSAELDERSRALLATERRDLQLVARVSELVVDLDGETGLDPIAALLVPGLVAEATFVVGDAPRRVGAPGVRRGRRDGTDPVRAVLEGSRDALTELDLSAVHPPGSASQQVAQRVRTAWRRTGRDAPDPVAVLAVPGRRGVLGLLVVRPVTGVGSAGLDEQTRVVLRLVARRVGLALENVWLYAHEHHLAETMQRAMLPQQAEVDGLDVWTYYAPNEHTAQVGGDWYDVLPIAPDVVGVVVGDVIGHDVEAAATMGQLRSVVRAYAFDTVEPAAVLDRVDQLVEGMHVTRAAGAVYSTLTRTDGAWRLDYTRAGHLPVLLVRTGTARLLDGGGGALIGYGTSARTAASEPLLPADVLVYYTDGLVERRDRSLRDGLDELVAVAAQVTATDAAGIGEDLLAHLVDVAEDDVAVVVLRVPATTPADGPTGGPRRRRWTLPGEAASIRLARRAVRRSCEAWDLAVGEEAELVVSELVANAVTHGWGSVTLVCYDTGDGLRIEVGDANPAPPVSTDGHPGRVGGYGIKIVERLADWGWRSSGQGKVVWARLSAAEPAPR